MGNMTMADGREHDYHGLTNRGFNGWEAYCNCGKRFHASTPEGVIDKWDGHEITARRLNNERNGGAVITLRPPGDGAEHCALCSELVDGKWIYWDGGVTAICYRHVGERVLYSVYPHSGPDPTIPATIVDEGDQFGYLVADADMTGPTWDLAGVSPLCYPESAYDVRIVTEDEFTTARNQEAN